MFANGLSSTLFATDSTSKYDSVIEAGLEPSDSPLRYISMRIYSVDGVDHLTGLQFQAENRRQLLNIEWEQYGSWTDWKEVPEGEEIVGLKCDI